MDIKQVDDVLTLEGLSAPSINALVPDEKNYSVLLMQPEAHIEADADGVRHHDSDLAQRQFGSFLSDACATKADLAITPEYSMPWETLIGAIGEGNTPSEGKLWVLGCESLKYGELEKFKQDLDPVATVLFEKLQPDPGRFVNPLAYVFLSPSCEDDKPLNLVILVQFKTYPMGDHDHFETNGMQRGTCIYQFGGIGESIKLLSLICSDALDLKEAQIRAIYHQALVIHIQLNPNPREMRFRRYREEMFLLNGDATEVICLNWARNVHHYHGRQTDQWHNASASAWYLRPNKFDRRDATLCANHHRGLYYTWHEPLHANTLVFNYEPAAYLLEATKVAHIGVPAAVSRRRGPQLSKRCIWDDAASIWAEETTAECGFSSIVDEIGPAKDEIERIANSNPINAERILALCAGKISHHADWYNVCHLDSFIINMSETVYRITFCQDNADKAHEFRVVVLRRCRCLWDILNKDVYLPTALVDFKQGFRFAWSKDYPHQNAISGEGQRATVIYMGEEVSQDKVEATFKGMAEKLQRAFSSPDESLSARQRLAVWFRDHEGINLFEPHRYVKIDQECDTSEFDIGREK